MGKLDENRKALMKYLKERYKKLGRNFLTKPWRISKDTGMSPHVIGKTFAYCIQKGDPVESWSSNGYNGTTYKTKF